MMFPAFPSYQLVQMGHGGIIIAVQSHPCPYVKRTSLGQHLPPIGLVVNTPPLGDETPTRDPPRATSQCRLAQLGP